MGRNRQRVGLARSLAIFFVAIAAAGLILGVLQGPFDQLVAASSDITQTSQAATGRGWIVTFWDALPFIVVLLGFVQLIGAAAAERRLPGQ